MNDPLSFPEASFDAFYQVQAMTYAEDLSAAFVDNDLTAVMEDLTIGEGVEKVDNMAAESAEKICLVEAIEEFDPAGYDEAADPDYDPLSAPSAEGNEAGEMDSGSDDEEEGMEQ